jgi:FKBP-type peptidyl-prolyl cis-trans isomerase
MKKTLVYIFLVADFALSGCLKKSDTTTQDEIKFAENEQQIADFNTAKNLGAVKTNIGGNPSYNLWYKNLVKVADSIKPVAGSQVSIRYSGQLLNSDSTKIANNDTASFGMSSNLIFYEPLLLMRKGESALFLLPSYLTYGRNTAVLNGATIPPYSVWYLKEVKLLNVRTEDQVLTDYLKAKKDTAFEKTATGVYHAVRKPGTGDNIKSGNTVTLTYKGFRPINGSVFDPVPTSSNPNPPPSTLTLKIGTNAAIPGFEEGLQLMKLNETGLLLLPSARGYGTLGSGTIGGYTPLGFEITITSVQ